MNTAMTAATIGIGATLLTDAWTVQASLENALDEQYELANGFNTADRSLFVATRVSFR